MTKNEALKLALKFVEDSECGTADLEAHIKEALAQPEQERMADHFDFGTYIGSHIGKEIKHRMEDYSPPQRTWVGLTHEEQGLVYGSIHEVPSRPTPWPRKPFWHTFADAIEAKLKEKNT